MSLTTRADLARFLSECKDRPKSEVIDDLYAMMGELGVQIRHDDQTPHDFDDEDAQVPRAPGAAVCRLLLSCGRRASASAAQREFGGLVIDTRTWAIIAAPPLALNPRPVAAVVDARLAAGDYEVYRVNDGTVVTLYSSEHPQLGRVWSMATINGYDVSPLRWMGPLTFAEVFFDLATRLYPAFVAAAGARLEGGRLAFDGLDPASTYVIGFRHHNFHPLRADGERMWLIQSGGGDADAGGNAGGAGGIAAGGAGIAAGALGLPLAVPVPLAALSQVTGTPPVVQPPTVASLAASCANALEEALALVAMAGAGAAAPATAGASPFHYGYILRLRPGAAAAPDHAHVLIESPLMARVRRLAYERAPRAVRGGLTADDRFAYAGMQAFLTMGEREMFVGLFPEVAPAFAEYSRFVNGVISEAVHELRLRQREPKGGAAAPPGGGAAAGSAAAGAAANTGRAVSRPATFAGHIAAKLIAYRSQQVEIAAPHRDAESIVRDMIIVPEFAYLFMRAVAASRGPAVSAPPAAARSRRGPRR